MQQNSLFNPLGRYSTGLISLILRIRRIIILEENSSQIYRSCVVIIILIAMGIYKPIFSLVNLSSHFEVILFFSLQILCGMLKQISKSELF